MPGAKPLGLATKPLRQNGSIWSEKALTEEVEAALLRQAPLWPYIAMTVLGLVGIVGGANLLIEGAIELARRFGISETVIGLTIVAVGTSLPELATSVIAALRRHSDVAIGNVIGSNIFNLLGILGTTALYRPIEVPGEIVRLDAWVMLGSSLLAILFAMTRAQIERWEGTVLLAAYAAYLIYLSLGLPPAGAEPASIR